eukprot:scaffold21430_cov17-Prasinocladus_malaysianus.AAC.1
MDEKKSAGMADFERSRPSIRQTACEIAPILEQCSDTRICIGHGLTVRVAGSISRDDLPSISASSRFARCGRPLRVLLMPVIRPTSAAEADSAQSLNWPPRLPSQASMELATCAEVDAHGRLEAT